MTSRATAANETQQTDTMRNLYLSGLLAGLVMVVAMIALRSVSETESLVEIIAAIILRFMPIELFSFTLQLLKGWAKPLLLGSVMIGMIVTGGWIARLDRGPALDLSPFHRLRRIILLAIGIWIPCALLTLLAGSIGAAGTLTNQRLLALGTMLLIDFLIFSVAFHLIYPVVSGAWRLPVDEVDSPPEDLSRRRLIGQAGTAVVAAGGALYLGSFLRGIRAGTGADDGEIPPPVTPNGDFYTVSKNFIDPSVDSDGWALDIEGLVEQPYSITYDELRAMPHVEQMATLTCISNEIGGDLIGNTVWTGVRLSDLIERAGVIGGPMRVAFFGDDGYSDSFEFSKALEPTTIVAYLMDGEPLPKSHGFPARLIVPGKYGIKNGKWLQRIELVQDFRGYWQQRGWTQEGRIKTMSTIEAPVSRAVLPREPVEIGGVAFAGDRGISRVELSTDDGETWRDADEINRVGPLSWAIWRTLWTPPDSGTYELVVRATDGTGDLQTDEGADPVPDGASGHHRIVIGIT